MAKKAECPLVLVEWEDSRQPVSQWVRLKDMVPAEVCRCVSVGFLIKDEEGQKVLAPNMANIEDADDIQASGIITIPSRSVIRMERLEEIG